jgi:hypothetical protein
MSMTQQLPPLKAEALRQQLVALGAFVRLAAHEGTPIHEAERGIWQRLRKLDAGSCWRLSSGTSSTLCPRPDTPR